MTNPGLIAILNTFSRINTSHELRNTSYKVIWLFLLLTIVKELGQGFLLFPILLISDSSVDNNR